VVESKGIDAKVLIYLHGPDHFPGELKPRDLLSLFQRFDGLSREEAGQIKSHFGADMMTKPFAAIEDLEKAKVVLILARLAGAPVIILSEFAFADIT
jgi:hypothetical protein